MTCEDCGGSMRFATIVWIALIVLLIGGIV